MVQFILVIVPMSLSTERSQIFKVVGALGVAQVLLTVGTYALYRVIRQKESETINNKAKKFLDELKELSDDILSREDNRESTGESAMLSIPSNTFKTILQLPLEGLDEEVVRNLYGTACLGNARPEYTTDLWNILCVMIEDEFGTDKAVTEIKLGYRSTLLATALMMKGKYALKRHVDVWTLRHFQVVALQEDVVDANIAQYSESQYQEFLTLCRYTTAVAAPLHIAGIALLDAHVLDLFGLQRFDLKTVLLTEIAAECAAQAAEGSSIPLLSFLSGVFRHTSGKLLIAHTLFSVASQVMTSIQAGISKIVMGHASDKMAMVSLLSLATQDYIPDDAWSLPSLISDALEYCDKCVAERGIHDACDIVNQSLGRVTSFFAYPVQCIVAWSAAEHISYLEKTLRDMVPLIRHIRLVKKRKQQQQGSKDKKKFAVSTAQRIKEEEEAEEGANKKQKPSTMVQRNHLGLCTLLSATSAYAHPPAYALLRLGIEAIPPIHTTAVVHKVAIEFCDKMIAYAHDNTSCVNFYTRMKDDLAEEMEECPVNIDLSISADLFPLLHRSGLPVQLTAPDTTENNGMDRMKGPDEVEQVVGQLLSRAQAIPLSLGLAVSDAVGQPMENLSAVELSDAYNRIEDFSENAGHVVDTAEPGFFSRKNDILTYDHSTQSSKVMYYSFKHQLEILTELHSQVPTIDNKPWGACYPLPDGPWSIEFKDVCFAYPGARKYILQDISFKVEAGQQLGIIGFSGAGKTTILLLINRIYAPTSGQILVNGIPIEQFSVRAFRRRVAFAWQDANSSRFFDDIDIESNIALGDILNATPESIRNSLRIAEALDSMESRSGGLKSVLDAKKFSGGEIERLNIARAVHRNIRHSALMMMDESMSAVDSITESRIKEALEAQWKENNRRSTVIMVTHRLASVKDCDVVVVVANGRVSEKGTWDELVKNPENKNFHTLLASQRVNFNMS